MIDPNLGIAVADRYEIIRLLGRGGYGAVYVAEPVSGDGPPVALKLLKSEVAHQRQVLLRFEREARVLEMLDCAHTPRLHASGRLPDGGAYIAMDFIDGETVTHAVRRGPLAAERVLRIARAVLDVLIRLHALDPPVYHRDLKPSNLMLCPGADGEETVYVLDFGIAKVAYAAEQVRTVQTAQGMMPGSIAYSAPERFEGRDDPRSDLYSLGVIMFEALTGRNPFRHKSPAESMRAHLMLPVPDDLSMQNVEPALADFVTRALAKTPETRFASARAMLDALRLLPIAAPAGADGDDTDLTPLPAAQFAADAAAARARAKQAADAETARAAAAQSSTPIRPAAPVSTPPMSTPPHHQPARMSRRATADAWLTDARVDAKSPRLRGRAPTALQPKTTDAAVPIVTLNRVIWALSALIGIFIVSQIVKRIAAPAQIVEHAQRVEATEPVTAVASGAPKTAAVAVAKRYEFVTVVAQSGPARFVQVESKQVLCESARTCKVPIDVDTRVEREGYESRVLAGDDLYDRRGHRWRVSLRAR